MATKSKPRAARSRAPRAGDEISGSARERILAVSRRMVEEEGLGALSMREVARRAGLSHQAPYNYFADRESILAAVAQEGFESIRARFLAALEAQQGRQSAAAETLVELGHVYLRFACEQPAQFRLMFRPEMVDLSRHDSAREAGELAFNCVKDAVGAVQRMGVLPEVPHEVLTTLVWSVAHGLACLVLDGPVSSSSPTIEPAALIEAVIGCFGNLLVSSQGNTSAPQRSRTDRSREGKYAEADRARNAVSYVSERGKRS